MDFKNYYLNIENLEHRNQYIITIQQNGKTLKIFQSYYSTIAIYNVTDEILTLTNRWNYSITTLKHLYMFIYHYAYAVKKDNEKWDLWNYIAYSKNKKQKIYELIKMGIIKLYNRY